MRVFISYIITVLFLTVAIVNATYYWVWEGNKLAINCAQNEYIDIKDAFYGRTSRCGYDVTPMMISECSGKQSCSVGAYNSIFGDSCSYIVKYLDTHYDCVPITTKVPLFPKYWWEWQDNKLTIGCESFHHIVIKSAYYGRSFENCGTDVTSKMASECSGKGSCSVWASNSIFGNPCPNIDKYLETYYYCMKDCNNGFTFDGQSCNGTDFS